MPPNNRLCGQKDVCLPARCGGVCYEPAQWAVHRLLLVVEDSEQGLSTLIHSNQSE